MKIYIYIYIYLLVFVYTYRLRSICHVFLEPETKGRTGNGAVLKNVNNKNYNEKARKDDDNNQ